MRRGEWVSSRTCLIAQPAVGAMTLDDTQLAPSWNVAVASDPAKPASGSGKKAPATIAISTGRNPSMARSTTCITIRSAAASACVYRLEMVGQKLVLTRPARQRTPDLPLIHGMPLGTSTRSNTQPTLAEPVAPTNATRRVPHGCHWLCECSSCLSLAPSSRCQATTATIRHPQCRFGCHWLRQCSPRRTLASHPQSPASNVRQPSPPDQNPPLR